MPSQEEGSATLSGESSARASLPTASKPPSSPRVFWGAAGAPSPISLADSPSPEIRKEGRGSSWLSHLVLQVSHFQGKSPGEPRPAPKSRCPCLPPSSNGSVPEDRVLPAAGRGAGLSGLGPPPPAREDGHALLLAETAVGAVARLDFLAHAALALDHLQQLAVALAGRLGRQGQRQRQCWVGLCPFLPPPAPTGRERKKRGSRTSE